MSEQEVRRNSLGFIIRPKLSARNNRASIVWAKRPDGSRVFILEAERGSKQGLKCECGSVLVAKQGEIQAWHFAHKANQRAYCKAAVDEALAAFASRVVLTQGIIVPGPAHYVWRPEEVDWESTMEGVVLRTRDGSTRLDIFIGRKRWPAPVHATAQRALGVSALAIVLGEAIQLEDAAIEAGLHRGCSRSWVFNRKAPLVRLTNGLRRLEPPPTMDLAARWEEMFPAELERRRLHSKRWQKDS